MLKELYIENLAVIEKATISFCGKLNVFSGETGAGKSILIGGINAVLGGRITKDIVRFGAEKAVVTALFDDIPEAVRERLAENGFEAEDELLLQREISADGKSVARINGRTATVAVLKDAAAGLIDIHGQHDTAILLSVNSQREILDSFGGFDGLMNGYREKFREFSHVSKQLRTLQEASAQKERLTADLTERVEELQRFAYKRGEEAETEKKLEAARNYEKIQRSLSSAYNNISGADDGIGAVGLVRGSRDELQKISALLPNGAEILERIQNQIVELDDIKSEIAKNISEDFDASQLAYLEERMSDILRMKRKYGFDTDEMPDRLAQWEEQLAVLQNSDSETEKLAEHRRKLADELKTAAQEITAKRKATAEMLEKKITEELVFLDMPAVKLIFSITQDKITINGMDNVEMLISVNRGEEPKPMNKVASGGELSRIMLAIKNVLSSKEDIPTMIFDEIDTGISGRAAQKVGVKLSEIAQKRQVLCVTHLAQIAAMADNHLLIEKTADENRTYTKIKSLSFDERKREIARIISGTDSEAAQLSAEELLNRK